MTSPALPIQRDHAGDNPIRHIRLRENLTQTALAAYLGVSKQFVIRLEQGCYEPNQRFMDFVKARGYDPDWFISNYYNWIEQTRINSYGTLSVEYFHNVQLPRDFLDDEYGNRNERIYAERQYDSRMHPLTLWREYSTLEQGEDINLTRLCILFCLHIPTIQNYEKGLVSTTPELLIDALRDSGYSDTVIKELEKRYQEHRKVLGR